MSATVGMPAIAVTPATSNSKDDSNSMTVHNSRNASNRTANTVGMPAKAGMLENLAKPATTCREANYSRDTVNIRDTAEAGIIGTSRMSTAVGMSE